MYAGAIHRGSAPGLPFRGIGRGRPPLTASAADRWRNTEDPVASHVKGRRMRDTHGGLRSGAMGRQAITWLVGMALLSGSCSPSAPTEPPPSAGASATAAPSSPAAPTSTAGAGPRGTVAPAASTMPAPSPLSAVPWSSTTPRGENPLVTCSGDIGPADPVAVVTLADENGDHGETVLRNYADIANPTTACEGVGSWTRLLDSRHLWTWDCTDGDCAFAVVDLPDAKYSWYSMPTSKGRGGTVAAVAADLQTMAWSRYDRSGGRELHVADSAGDHLVFRFPSLDGRCGSPFDSNRAAFSRSGNYLYVLDQSFPEWNTLVVVGGHDVLLAVEPPADGWDGGFPMMALWSPIGDTLYYRHGRNVYEWTTVGGRQRVLEGIPWLYPTISPDGLNLVYAIQKADGNHDLYLAPTSDLGNAIRIATNRTNPVFLNDTQLWYRSETGGACAGGEVPRPLVYNIRSGDESPSIIVSVETIWPGTSSNH